MIRAGVQPDLLGETYWSGTDNLWELALYALIVYVRAAAERSGQSVSELCSSRPGTALARPILLSKRQGTVDRVRSSDLAPPTRTGTSP
jgi:hypothetical protein